MQRCATIPLPPLPNPTPVPKPSDAGRNEVLGKQIKIKQVTQYGATGNSEFNRNVNLYKSNPRDAKSNLRNAESDLRIAKEKRDTKGELSYPGKPVQAQTLLTL